MIDFYVISQNMLKFGVVYLRIKNDNKPSILQKTCLNKYLVIINSS